MEGLVMVFGGLAMPLVTAVTSVMLAVITVIANLVGLLIQIVFGVTRVAVQRDANPEAKSGLTPGIGGTRDEVQRDTKPEAKPRLTPRSKRMVRYFAIFGIVIVGIVAVINFFFFEPVVGGIVKSQLEKRGVELKYSAFDGNLFTGRIELADLHAKGNRWDVGVERLEANFGMLSLYSSTKDVEKLHVSGLRGNAEMLRSIPGGKRNGKTKEKGKLPAFVIENLKVEDVSMELAYEGGGRPPIHSVRIASLEAEKFRSRWALFYLFFRSSLEGELNGSPFVVTVEDREPLGKSTRWKVASLPLAPLGGPFSMFEGGEVALDVRDDWLIDGRVEIDMDWRLTLTDVRAVAPKGSVVRKTVADFLNAKTEPVEIQFGLNLDPENFEGSSSEAANALYEGLADALAENAAKVGDITKEKAKELQDEAVDKAKGLLDRLRK